MRQLLSASNTKLIKSLGLGYRTTGLSFASSDVSGYQVCPKRSPGCEGACLLTAGRGVFRGVRKARIERTRLFFKDRVGFMAKLVREIGNAIRLAGKKGLVPCFRLNVLSDICWESVGFSDGNVKYLNIMERFPDIQFYDYTKIPGRHVPDNYHLTFSLSETNSKDAQKELARGLNLAVVFKGPLPKRFMSMPVISGDEHDLRFLDPSNVIIGLTAKGRMKKDTTGFAIDISAIALAA